MPLQYIQDKNGNHYVKWGASGQPYKYDPDKPGSLEAAKKKALKQAQAIFASGYRER